MKQKDITLHNISPRKTFNCWNNFWQLLTILTFWQESKTDNIIYSKCMHPKLGIYTVFINTLCYTAPLLKYDKDGTFQQSLFWRHCQTEARFHVPWVSLFKTLWSLKPFPRVGQGNLAWGKPNHAWKIELLDIFDSAESLSRSESSSVMLSCFDGKPPFSRCSWMKPLEYSALHNSQMVARVAYRSIIWVHISISNIYCAYLQITYNLNI